MNIIEAIPEGGIGAVILSILLLLGCAVAFGRLFSLIKMPVVVGQIIGGLVLGPTVLGGAFPALYDKVFFSFPGQGQALSVIYWLGLIYLMFSSGYEVKFDGFKNDRKIIAVLCVGATAIPFAAGYFLSEHFFLPHYTGANGGRLAFTIVFCIAIAVTSLPVISKIFMDLGLMESRFAKIVLATAAVQDLFLWILLSVATAIALNNQISVLGIAWHFIVTVALFVIIVFVPRLVKRPINPEKICGVDNFAFILCFTCIAVGTVFQVNIMYSAFLAGLLFKNMVSRNLSAETAKKIKDVFSAFFIPVYFAIVGFRINLDASFSVKVFLMFLLIAFVLEIAGCFIAMLSIRKGFWTSLNLGIAMNARGGPGIVLASVTFEMGIINYEFFCALILTTLISSAFAGYWIDFINRRGKLLAAE
ncbi:MAG: cation:proton antiporter [Chitinispirillia bacterium]|nr:cation:proton antiporter [Chitinispirillia bacterium]